MLDTEVAHAGAENTQVDATMEMFDVIEHGC
jgi:hypothetical protein